MFYERRLSPLGLLVLAVFFGETFRDGAHWRDSNYPSLCALARGLFIIPVSLESDLVVGSSAVLLPLLDCFFVGGGVMQYQCHGVDRARLLWCSLYPLNSRQSCSPVVMRVLKDGRVFLETWSSVASFTWKKKNCQTFFPQQNRTVFCVKSSFCGCCCTMTVHFPTLFNVVVCSAVWFFLFLLSEQLLWFASFMSQ